MEGRRKQFCQQTMCVPSKTYLRLQGSWSLRCRKGCMGHGHSCSHLIAALTWKIFGISNRHHRCCTKKKSCGSNQQLIVFFAGCHPVLFPNFPWDVSKSWAQLDSRCLRCHGQITSRISIYMIYTYIYMYIYIYIYVYIYMIWYNIIIYIYICVYIYDIIYILSYDIYIYTIYTVHIPYKIGSQTQWVPITPYQQIGDHWGLSPSIIQLLTNAHMAVMCRAMGNLMEINGGLMGSNGI